MTPGTPPPILHRQALCRHRQDAVADRKWDSRNDSDFSAQGMAGGFGPLMLRQTDLKRAQPEAQESSKKSLEAPFGGPKHTNKARNRRNLRPILWHTNHLAWSDPGGPSRRPVCCYGFSPSWMPTGWGLSPWQKSRDLMRLRWGCEVIYWQPSAKKKISDCWF